jgi:hypothetical protein
MAQTRTNTTLEEIQSISENMTKLQLQEWIHRQANELLFIKNMTMPTIKDNQRLKQEIEQLKQQKKEHGDSSYLQGYNHDRQEDAEYMWDFIRSQIDGDLKYHTKMFYEMFDENQYIIEGEKVVEVEDESDEE